MVADGQDHLDARDVQILAMPQPAGNQNLARVCFCRWTARYVAGTRRLN